MIRSLRADVYAGVVDAQRTTLEDLYELETTAADQTRGGVVKEAEVSVTLPPMVMLSPFKGTDVFMAEVATVLFHLASRAVSRVAMMCVIDSAGNCPLR